MNVRAAPGRSLADLRVFRVLIALLAALAGLALAYVAWQFISYFAHIWWLLVFAGLLAFVIAPAVGALQRRGVPRSLAVMGIYALILGTIALAIILAIGPLSNQLTALGEHLPATLNKSTHDSRLDRFFVKYHLPFRTDTLRGQALQATQQVAKTVLSNAVSLITTVASFIVDLVLVLVISIYLLIDAYRIHDNVLRLVPERHRDRAFFLEAAVTRVLGGYIRGQLLMALLIGALYGGGCFVLGVHYPLVIGVLAGLFELMPMIGPVLGAIPALAIAFTQSPTLALWVLLYHVVIQQLESHIIGPKITGQAVGLHPLGAIIALVAGVEVDGLVGALLGVPVAGILYVLAVAVYWETTGRSVPVRTRRDTLSRARAPDRRRTGPVEQSAIATTSSMVAGVGGAAPPPPQALADLGDKAALLREHFDRAEEQRAQDQEDTLSQESAILDARDLEPVGGGGIWKEGD